ncbi:voltage-gated purine nucleotide uniporter SLC17A9-like [Stigmatopora argus]
MADDGKELRTPCPEDPQVWSRGAARRWTAALFAGSCLTYCGRMSAPVCAPAMAAAFGWNDFHTGLALGAFFWGYAATQILGGHASDKFGGERVILLSVASWALVMVATPLLAHLGSHPLAVVMGSRVLVGILQGVFFPSLASLVARRSPEGQKSFLTSVWQSGSSMGILAASVLGSATAERYGWESVFYAAGTLSALWALLVQRTLLKGQVCGGRRWGAPSRSSSTNTSLLELLRKPSVRAAILAHMCTCGTSYILLSWMPTYFSQEHGRSTVWQYNVLPWAAGVPAALCGGRLSDWLIGRGYGVAFVRKSMQCVAMGVSSAFLLPLSNSAHVSFATATACISAAMVALNFTSCGVTANVQDLAPSCAGALYGAMNTLGALTSLLTVLLSGYSLEASGSWTSVFATVLWLHAVGLAVFLYFGDARRVDLDLPGVPRVDLLDSAPLC